MNDNHPVHQTSIDQTSVDPAASPSVAARVRDLGQATTEYALVLLAAALVGLLVVGWATTGGGAAAVGRLFQRVIQSVIDKV
jgi:hypothetical protein